MTDFNMNRTAHLSSEYVSAMEGAPKLSGAQKQQVINKLASTDGGITKIGQGMIGPIQIRLRYEGISRSQLVEDTLERGPLMPYDILDDLGMAYQMNQTESEVKVQYFEGKQVYPTLFRVAAFPNLRKEDNYYLRVNAVQYAQDESRQAILKQEDYNLITLLENAILLYGSAGLTPYGGIQTGITAGPAGATTEKTILIGGSNPVEPADFYAAAAMVEIDQLEANNILAHPQDLRDMYTWDVNTTGFAFKDDVFNNGKKITQFGEFKITKSIMVPQGETFLTADPEFVGVMPIMYSLDVVENHSPERFTMGWVMDELISQIVLNPRGLVRIVKCDTYAQAGTNAAPSVASGGLVRTNIANRGLLA